MADGIFGPTPEAIQRAIANERMQFAQTAGQLPLGTLPGVMGGFALADAIGDISGFQDPRLRRAQTLQQLQRETSAQGLNPGTREFTDFAVQRARALGDEGLAIEIFQLGNQLEQESLATQKARRELEPVDNSALLDARARALSSMGVDAATIPAIAADDETFKSIISARLKPAERTALQKNYEQAKLEGFTGSLQDYQRWLSGLRRGEAAAGATRIDLSVGEKKVDEAFAKDFAAFLPGGNATDIMKSISQLGDSIDRLEAAGDDFIAPTGPLVGLVGAPGSALGPIINPEGVAIIEQVQEVAQRNLKDVLGAQFTEREGERLINRAINPRLSPQENVRRLRRLRTQLESAFQMKLSAARYFQKHRTLQGWPGKLPSMSDFDITSKPKYKEGQIAQHRDGRRMIYRSGKWQPL